MIAHHQIIDKFIDAMAEQGLTCKSNIIGDGEFHTFSTDGDKKGERSGRYFLHINGSMPAGYFGCWRKQEWHTWSYKDKKHMTPEERRAFRETIAKARAKHEAELAQRHKEARAEAKNTWDMAVSADDTHPYLRKKGLPAIGIRNLDGVLIIPMRDSRGTIHSLQKIHSNGFKQFVYGGAIKGHYHVIGAIQPTNMIYLTEGLATGLTVHLATKKAVIIAFTAANLVEVAQTIREQYSHATLVIAADDDQFNPVNAGRKCANEAARVAKAQVVFPTFDDLSGKPTDFDDLRMAQGLEEVRRQLTHDVSEPEPDEEHTPFLGMDELRVTEFLETPARPMEYIIDGVMPVSKTGLLVAPGGTGKSMLLLQLAISVATGIPFLGRFLISKPGGVLAFFAEDDKDELHRRFENAVRIICESPEIGADRFKLDLEKNLFMASLVGWDGIALTETTPAGPARTTAFNRFMATARQIPDLRLIIFDPTSHFMGGDENFSLDAVRYVQALQAFSQETGAFVLAVQHTNKQSSRSGDPMSQHAARGSAQLTNTVRWQMNMATMDPKTARNFGIQADRERKQCVQVDIAKSNYAPQFGQIWLRRGIGGFLHFVELSTREQAEIERVLDDAVAKIKECAANGKQYSRRSFCVEFAGQDGLGCGRDRLQKIVGIGIDRGRIHEDAPIEKMRRVPTVLYAT